MVKTRWSVTLQRGAQGEASILQEEQRTRCSLAAVRGAKLCVDQSTNGSLLAPRIDRHRRASQHGRTSHKHTTQSGPRWCPKLVHFSISRFRPTRSIFITTRAIVWDWPLGVSLYVEVFSFATRPFKFLFIYSSVANNTVCGVVALENWLIRFQVKIFQQTPEVQFPYFGTSHSTLQDPVEFLWRTP